MLPSIHPNSSGQEFLQQIRALHIPIIPPELVIRAINNPALFAKFRIAFNARAGIPVVSDHVQFGNQILELHAIHLIAIRAGGPDAVRTFIFKFQLNFMHFP